MAESGKTFGSNMYISGSIQLNGLRTIQMAIDSAGAITFDPQGRWSGISAIGY